MTGPVARLLDLTRLVSRSGRVLTGVDRVELAYLRAIIADDLPAFGIVRTALGHVLLNRDGMQAVERAATGGDWGRSDLLSRLALRLDPARRAGQSLVRGHALARCLPSRLGPMLARHLPAGTVYLNTGHSNLTQGMLAGLEAVRDARVTVLIHDTIPLDLPDMQRTGTVAAFAGMLRRVSQRADLVICTSDVCRGSATRHLAAAGRVPPIVTAHLGVTPAVPDPAAIPPGLRLNRPYFITVGTIEPRKNHALLLDVWDMLARDLPHAQMPALVICGHRGWRNAAVFERLDRHAQSADPHVFEAPGLSDGAVAALVKGARAMLFPSLAEGFGLPPAEAAALGTPVVCGDLAIWHEVLGDAPVYLDHLDGYEWRTVVCSLMSAPATRPIAAFVPPDWSAHFKTVLRVT